MKNRKSLALAGGLLALGLVVGPAVSAQAGTRTGSFSCPAGRQAVVTASATWQVTLTAGGKTASKSVATGGAVVTIRTGRTSGTYSATSANPNSTPSVSYDCSVL